MPLDTIEIEPLIPLPNPSQYVHLKSMTEALKQAQTLSGLEDKEICGRGEDDIINDPGTWSKIKKDQGLHFPHNKLVAFNKRCGNLVVLAWFAEQHGYMLRPKETEMRRMLRRFEEMVDEKDKEIQALRRLIKEAT